MTPAPANYSLSPRNRQIGLSLVELMISLTIGLVLLAGLTTLIVQQSNTRNELEKSSRQIENGRYAMQILHGDIQHAGFYGQYFTVPAASAVMAAMPDPCTTTLTLLDTAMSLPIQGYDAPAAVAAPLNECLNDANHVAGTDILVIRRADTGTTTIANAAASAVAGTGGLVYLQASAASHVLNTGTAANTTNFPLTYSTTANTGAVELRPYLVYIYFVSPCSTMNNGATCTATDDSGRPIPTLKRLELSASGVATAFTMTPLVEGIENMQLDYGLDNDNDGYPDAYTTAPATVTAWSNAMAIRVNLLARNNDPTTGHVDVKNYCLSGNAALCVVGNASYVSAPNDTYKRHVFSELIRTTNPSGRRALQ